MNRRQLIKGIGAALCAGAVPPFLPGLIGPKMSMSMGEMLNQYLNADLLRAELGNDGIMHAIAQGNQWRGASLIVPFRSQPPSKGPKIG